MLCAMKAVVLLASLVVLVAIVSACGGAEESSDQPTAVQETSVEDEYFRQVGDAFQQAKEQMEALEISSEGSPIAREDLLTTFRVYYHGHLEVARSMRDKLQAIDSPAQFNEAHNAAIGAINELIAMVQNLSQLADGADPQTLPDSELVSGTLLIPYRVREACLGLQRLADGHDVIVDLSCEQSAVAESNGAECQTTASGVECCGVIPGPDSQGTASEGCW